MPSGRSPAAKAVLGLCSWNSGKRIRKKPPDVQVVGGTEPMAPSSCAVRGSVGWALNLWLRGASMNLVPKLRALERSPGSQGRGRKGKNQFPFMHVAVNDSPKQRKEHRLYFLTAFDFVNISRHGLKGKLCYDPHQSEIIENPPTLYFDLRKSNLILM